MFSMSFHFDIQLAFNTPSADTWISITPPTKYQIKSHAEE